MTWGDRVGRSVFVALCVGLGWGIRGDFGHLVGAMFPGAALALALAYVSGQRSLFLWMPILAAVSAIGIGAGGATSYGILHGYAQADTFINYAYGFLTLFLQGSAWGTFGGAMIGLLLERRPLRSGDWLGLAASILAGGWVTSFVVVDVLGFHINPPRNNSSIAFMGAAVGQILWLVVSNRPTALRGALLGYVGFGLGMAGGRLLGNIANVMQSRYDFTINHWNVMEISCGLIGGFIYCFGMVNRAYPDPPENENLRYTSILSIFYVLGIIPLWHRLGRIEPQQKLEEWSKQLQSYGYENPQEMAQTILWLVDGVCVLGFVGAVIWLVIYLRQQQKWAAVPVIWLSLTMLLFQNLTAFYFFYPHRAGSINMHNVFWILFIAMLAYVAFARPRPATQPDASEIVSRNIVWRWLAGAAVGLAGIIAAAGLVNGPETMKAANTRWPIWAWTQGPFPGQQEKP